MEVVSYNSNILQKNTENDPIVKLLNEKLDVPQKEFFIQSYLLFRKHDEEKDFVVSLDDVWQIMGYSSKGNAKTFFMKCEFIQNVHYQLKIREKIAFASAEAKKGGQNAEILLMTPKTFKHFCMKSEKSIWIRNYFIAVESVVLQYTNDVLQKKLKYERAAGKEQAILNQFQNSESINYIRTIPDEAIIDGIALNEDEKLGKFGETFKSGKSGRNKDHKNEIGENSFIIFAIESPNAKLLESRFKEELRKQKRLVSAVVNGKNQTELVLFDKKFPVDRGIELYTELNNKLKEGEYLKHRERMKELEIEAKRLEIDSENKKLDFENKKLDFENKKLDFENKKLDSENKKLEIEAHREIELKKFELEMKKIELESKKKDEVQSNVAVIVDPKKSQKEVEVIQSANEEELQDDKSKKYVGVARNKSGSFYVSMRHGKKTYRASFKNKFHGAHQYDLWLIEHRKQEAVNCISETELEGFVAQNGLPTTRNLPNYISLLPNGKYHAEKKRRHLGYFDTLPEAEAELARFDADPDNWQLPKRREMPRHIRYDERYNNYSFRKIINKKEVWKGPFKTLQEAEAALKIFLQELI